MGPICYTAVAGMEPHTAVSPRDCMFGIWRLVPVQVSGSIPPRPLSPPRPSACTSLPQWLLAASSLRQISAGGRRWRAPGGQPGRWRWRQRRCSRLSGNRHWEGEMVVQGLRVRTALCLDWDHTRLRRNSHTVPQRGYVEVKLVKGMAWSDRARSQGMESGMHKD